MRRLLLALATATLLAACGQAGQNDNQPSGQNDNPTSGQTAPATPRANDADVTFVQGMLPHHQQAIEMAQMVTGHTQRPELTQLAANVVRTQTAEVATMQGWLQAWGKAPMAADHGGMPMPGMMSTAEMDRLAQLRAKQFDLAFVDMMAAHHQGAIALAQTELQGGSLPEVKRLAQAVVTAQQAEVAKLSAWKQAWSGTAAG